MLRLTLLATLVASTTAVANDGLAPYQANPITPLSPTALKSSIWDISNLYYIQFPEAPLATAAQSLQQVGIQSMHNAGGRLNVKAPASQLYLNRIAKQRKSIQAQLNAKLGRSLQFEQEYGIVLNAATVRLSPAEAERLRSDKSILRVEKVKMHQLHTDAGPGFIGADHLWDGSWDMSGTDIGTKGEGVIVGIIDTGIDADHPSFTAQASDGYAHTNPLGSGTYVPNPLPVTDPEAVQNPLLNSCLEYDWICNDKLIGVMYHPEVPDYFPSTISENFQHPNRAEIISTGWDFHGHGTHVAATAAGNPVENVPITNDLGDEAQFRTPLISGVAPRANIISYQSCLPYSDNPTYGGCFPNVAIYALEHAIENGVDVINYSVGGGANSPWNTLDSLAFLNARVAGLHIATAAGNAGPTAGTVGSPGNAPWITTVAAYTHDRGYTDKQLSGFEGGDSTPAPLDGKGATYAYTGDIVDAAAFGDSKCNTPFSADTFNGEIVLCRRGDIARVEKGSNVLAGGAGGMILINTDTAIDNVVADLHVLPAIQLNKANGDILLDWLASGEGHRATIEAATQTKNPENGDMAGFFTSRGPGIPFASTISPDLAAPGVDILAAHTTEWPYSDTTPPEFSLMSGTSMASPHVAGALALITKLRPEWTPAEVQSVLMSTAKTQTYTDDDFDGVKIPSTPFDAGTGRVQLEQAVNAGLLMNITEAEYLAADPALDGDPSSLNLPSMAGVDCLIACEWTRTVEATVDGTWTTSYEVQTEGVTLNISPVSFTLAAGETQELTITATAGSAFASEWGFGRVLLNHDGAAPMQHLTVAAQFIGGTGPGIENGREIFTAHRDADSHTLSGFVSIGSDDLQLTPYGLAEVEVFEGQTLSDPEAITIVRNPDTYFAVPVTVTSDTKMFGGWISEAEAPDMDMFIVLDADLNGKPSMQEIHNAFCVSGAEHSDESCALMNPAPGSYLIVIHNYQGTEPYVWNSHSLSVVNVKKSTNSFTLEAPATVGAAEEFDVTIHWNQEMEEGKSYLGMFDVGTHADLPTNIGTVVFEIQRGESDVSLSVDSTSVKAGDSIGYGIELMANNSGAERVYTLSTTVPAPFSVLSAEGGQIDGNTVTWSVTQEAAAMAQSLGLVVGTDAVVSTTDFVLELQHSVSTVEDVTLTLKADSVAVAGRPMAMINGETAPVFELQTPATLSLSGEQSQGEEGETLSYQWRQVSGPTLTLTGSDSVDLTVEAPGLSAAATAVIELVVTTESGTSLPVTATLKLAAKPQSGGSSGGSLGYFALLLLAGALGRRR
ncbi:S8 family serine peptidase [Ferrimonas gelatinilytica]|uniref:Peptidase S8 n=1 Tax=Ferrimonas gelatinilytica TaxID=1255257 RepID=A0ABP9S213_9GAMM